MKNRRFIVALGLALAAESDPTSCEWARRPSS